MNLKQVFKKTWPGQETRDVEETLRPEVPVGIMKKCNHCRAAVMDEEVKEHHYICPKCHKYFRMPAYARIRSLADKDTFEEWDQGMTGRNPMNYARYERKLDALREKTGLDEAVVTGKARIMGHETVLCVMDSRFLMASMGSVVGEKIARAAERALEQRLPVVIFSCSGGARMQEGIVSLMQMVKTSAALKKHSEAGLLYISVLTDPVTGGVTASFAMQGDIILSEPGALVGFAGPRVIEQTIGQKLPAGFQTAEYLLEHGFIDAVVERESMRETLAFLLAVHEDKGRNRAAEERFSGSGTETSGMEDAETGGNLRSRQEHADTGGILRSEQEYAETGGALRDGRKYAETGGVLPDEQKYAELGEILPDEQKYADAGAILRDGREYGETGEIPPDGQEHVQTEAQDQEYELSGEMRDAWDRVQTARDRNRPSGQDFIDNLFTDFMEFHGDRCLGDDRALVGGVAYFMERPVTALAQIKGNTLKEQKQRHFGMTMPEGYRKALRLMLQAEKFRRPVICFVDTPGAFCGVEAEEHGQGEAIARNLYEMADLKTPVLAILIGEGGSGGALALAVANEVWMLENAVYSILSPEGFASILWKDSKRAGEAARIMGLTAPELKKMGIVERVLPEPEKLTKENMMEVCGSLRTGIEDFLGRYASLSGRELAELRYRRFRKM